METVIIVNKKYLFIGIKYLKNILNNYSEYFLENTVSLL